MEDVVGLDSLRSEFEAYIVERIKYPDEYEVSLEHFGIVSVNEVDFIRY